uniref:Uncharacterized protein n=1 Tax=Acrobeloides nanus TaxID=290746 RepID=A0A914DI49_9BILA
MDMDEDFLDIPLTTVFKDIKRNEKIGTNEDRPRSSRRTSRTPTNRRRARGMINRKPTTKRNSIAKKSLYLLNHINLNGSYMKNVVEVMRNPMAPKPFDMEI